MGSCNMDLVAFTPRLPVSGETIHGHSFEQVFGGKGANQAVQAATVGAKTAMVGTVGADSLGDSIISNFKAVGVDAAHVGRTDESATGVALISVDDAGNNTIVVVGGANLKLTAGDVEAAKAAIEAAKVVVCQLEVTEEATLAALRLARAAGARTILNPAPAHADLNPELLAAADVVCPNETETALLVDMPTGTIEECTAAAQELRRRGAGAVLMTLGAQGSLYVDGDTTHHEPAAGGVTAVDTTGAGDSFLGSFAAFASRGDLAVPECMRRATAVAAESVQRKGAQSSYLDAAELPAWVTA